MATKLYLHSATSTVSGTLPTDEQSSLTPDANDFEGSRTTNRTMNTTIGVSQANLTNTSTGDTNAHNYYITRFVSPLLYQGNISAQTWTMEYAAKEANAAANFPRNGAGAMYVNCYVWKPSDGTKVGTILDGNSNADGEEAGTTQTVINFTFSGAAVTGMTPGDAVLVIEMWAQVTQGNGTTRVQDVYFDGTTENSTTSEAAFLSTPENLQFTITEGNMTVMAAGGSGTSTANTTQFIPPVGEHNAPTATEAEAEIVIRTAGTLSKLSIRLTTNGISGGTTVFTLRKNGSDTGMTVSFAASTTGLQEDLTNTVSVSAGDKICIKSVPGGATGTWTMKIMTLNFVASNEQIVQILGSYQSNSIALASSTRYFPIGGRLINTSTENSTKTRQRVAGTYAKLMVYVSANARTNSTTFKSRKNGADGNLSITIGAGVTGVFEDTSNSDTVSSGDDYNVAVTTGTGTESITFTVMKIEFTNTEYKGMFVTANTGSSADILANVTTYLPVGGSSIATAEASIRRKIRNTRLIISELHVYLSANTVSANSTATLRKNGVATGLTVTLTANTTGLFSDTTHTVDVGSSDELALEIVTGATGTSLRVDNVVMYYHTGRVSQPRTYKYHVLQRVQSPSVLLDGSNDYLQCGDHSGLWSQGLTKFSFSCWLYFPVDNTGSDKFVVCHGNATNHGFRIVYFVATKKLTFIIKNSGGTNIDAAGNAAVTAGKWIHVVCTYDNSLGSQNLKEYIDKTVQTDTGDLTETINLTDELTLGTEQNANTPNCNIKDFRFWKNKALTQTEVNDVADNSPSAPTPDYWLPTHEGTGNPVDVIAGKTTTLTNGATWENRSPGVLGGLTRFYKYHIQGRISQSRIYKYHVQARTSLSRIYKYHIANRVSLSRIYKYHVQSRVSLARSYLYNVIGRVSLSRVYKYHVANRVSLSRIYKYHLLGRVSLSRSYLYNLIGRVSLSRIYKYNLIGRVSLSRIYKYNLLSRVSLSSILKYNILSRISLSKIYKYHIQSRVSLARTYLYNVIGRVSLSRIYKYNILSRVSLARTYLWNVLESDLIRVSKDQIYKWNMDARVSLSRVYKYNVASRVSLSRIYLYNIVGRVSLSRTYLYNIVGRVSLSRIYKYNIQSRVSLSRSYLYNIQQRISLSNVYKYNVQARVSLARTYLWDVIEGTLERISKSQIYKWNVQARISLTHVYKYNLLARTSLTTILKYNILGRVSQSRVYKYNLLGRLSKSSILKYNVLSRVSLSRSYKYHITNLVSKASVLKYNVIGRISKPSILKYNIIGRISKVSILKYHVTHRVSQSRIYRWSMVNRISKAQTYMWNVLHRITISSTFRWNFGALQSIREGPFNPDVEGKNLINKRFHKWKSSWYRTPTPRRHRESKYRRG